MTASGILRSARGSGSHHLSSSRSRPSFRHGQSSSLSSSAQKKKKKKLRKKSKNKHSKLYNEPGDHGTLEDSGQGSDEKCYCEEGDQSNDSCSTWSMDSCPLCKAELGEHEHSDDEIITDE